MSKFSLLDIIPEIDPIKIIDIGAMSLGQDTSPYAHLVKSNKAQVIGFEPDQHECDKLNREHGHPHKFFPYFIGDGTRQTYYQTNNAMTGSLYKPNDPLLQKFHTMYELTTLQCTHSVQTKKLDDIHEIDDVDFIKIDVQGSELKVFQGAAIALSRATVIRTEVCFVELYEKQPTFGDIDQYLRSCNFQFHTMPEIASRCFKPIMFDNNPYRGLAQWLWADAVYVKNFMRLETMPATKLLKMAVVVHDILNSWDLCHLILTEVDRQEGSEFAASYLQKLTGM